MKINLVVLLLALVSFISVYSQPPTIENAGPGKLKVDSLPRFPAGGMGWKRYLEQNLDAGTPNRDKAPPGDYKVTVEFTVAWDGSVSNVRPVVVPELCKSCGAEAVRIIEKGPKWIPASLAGKPVDYKQTQSISFRVQKEVFKPGLIQAGPPVIPFRNITLQEAIREAGEKGKIVFAQYISSGCNQCNETADMAFASKELAALVDEKCVPVKIDVYSSERSEFNHQYNPRGQIGTFFISPDSELLAHFAATTSRASDYMSEIAKAVAKQTEGRVTLRELDDQWKADPRDFTAMELNLARRKSFGWNTSALLDEYVNRLPEDSQQSVRVRVFVAGMAPTLFSKANTWLRQNNNLFSRAWFSLPEPLRIKLNSLIINGSMSKAISIRSAAMATTVATFARSTYEDKSSVKAQQGYDRQMLHFYQQIADTTTYLTKAIAYYDQYYMSIPLADILRVDSVALAKARDTAKKERTEDPLVKGRYITRTTVRITPAGSLIGNEMVQGAQSVYRLSNNLMYLQRAVTWVRRAKAFYAYADANGLLPKLLYVTGEKTKAIAMQKEHVKKLQQMLRKATTDEAILNIMEKGKVLPHEVFD